VSWPCDVCGSDRFKGVIAFKVDLGDRIIVVYPADVTIVTVDDKPPGYCVLCGCPRWAPHSTDHDPQWVIGFFGDVEVTT
jgi:hypothetical protein